MTRHTQILALLLIAAALAGCPSVAPMTTARPLGAGKNAMVVAGSIYGFSVKAVGNNETSSGSTTEQEVGVLILPIVDVMYRRGLGSRVDIGVALRGYGQVGFDVKVNLVNTPAFALSLDPGVGGVFFGTGNVAAGYLQVDAPLLIDIAFSSRVRLAFAPKYTGIFAFSTDEGSTQGAGVHLLGGHAGHRVRHRPHVPADALRRGHGLAQHAGRVGGGGGAVVHRRNRQLVGLLSGSAGCQSAY